MNLLQIEDLAVEFRTSDGPARAVDGVNIRAQAGDTVALVGESGCGKTVTALAVMDLVPKPAGKIARGQISFGGKPLPLGEDDRMQSVRGGKIGMIFQEPLTSLNPVIKIGEQIGEMLDLHTAEFQDKNQRREKILELLRQVGLPDPQARIDQYPHSLSGGMLQRVMIAMALACGPRLLIADEPTTALDVTIQAQIMHLLSKLKQQNEMAVLLITHDLGVVKDDADFVYVMYAGQIVESGPVAILENPQHPYTRGLIDSLPGSGELKSIPGTVPAATEYTATCRFAPRCARRQDKCTSDNPQQEYARNGRVACFFPVEPS